MPEPIVPEEASIADAFKIGLESTPDNGDGASPDNSGDQPNGDGKPAPKAGEDPANPADPNKQLDEQNKETDPNKGKNPADQNANGEYTKERFDGLMSAWQTDKGKYSKDIADLNTKIESIIQSKNQGEAPANSDEIELPDELKDADPEARQGYNIVAKGVKKMLAKSEQQIVGKILDIINKPVKEQNELKTAVDNEIAKLKVSLGPEFEKNIKSILKYASDEGYNQGFLGLAYKNWKRDRDHAAEIAKLNGGKKAVEEIKAGERTDAGIPTGGKNKTGEIPVFDPKRDGEKSISEILRESADLF